MKGFSHNRLLVLVKSYSKVNFYRTLQRAVLAKLRLDINPRAGKEVLKEI